jgi:hypothetical protein
LFIACIDPKDILQPLLPAGTSRKKEIDTIGMLDAYLFIIRRSADLALDLYQLVYLAIQNWLRKEELLVQSTERVIVRLGEVFPDDNYKNRSVWRMYLLYTRYILESNLVNKDKENRISLLWKYRICLYKDGQ